MGKKRGARFMRQQLTRYASHDGGSGQPHNISFFSSPGSNIKFRDQKIIEQLEWIMQSLPKHPVLNLQKITEVLPCLSYG